MKYLRKLNEYADWEADKDTINDIVNIAKDGDLRVDCLVSGNAQRGKYYLIRISSYNYHDIHSYPSIFFPSKNPQQLVSKEELLRTSSDIFRRLENEGFKVKTSVVFIHKLKGEFAVTKKNAGDPINYLHFVWPYYRHHRYDSLTREKGLKIEEDIRMVTMMISDK